MLMPNLLRARCCGALIFGVEVVRAVLVMLGLCAAICANLSEVFLLGSWWWLGAIFLRAQWCCVGCY